MGEARTLDDTVHMVGGGKWAKKSGDEPKPKSLSYVTIGVGSWG